MDISCNDYRCVISVQKDRADFELDEKGHIDVLEDFCVRISSKEAAKRGLNLGDDIPSLAIVNILSCGVFLGHDEVDELTIEDELLKNVFRGDEGHMDYSDAVKNCRELYRLETVPAHVREDIENYDEEVKRVKANLAKTKDAWKKQIAKQIDHATQYFIDRIKAMIEYYADEDNFDEGYLDIDFVKMCQVLDSIN